MDTVPVKDEQENLLESNQSIVKQGRKFFSKIGLIFLIGTLVILALQIMTGYLLQTYAGRQIRQDMNVLMTLNVIAVYVIGLPLISFLLHRMPAVKPVERKMTLGSFLVAFLMCYALVYITNWIGTGITYIIGLLKGGAVLDRVEAVTTELHPALSILYTVICAPILEELVFRKRLIDRTLVYGEGVSILMSGLIFGLFHGNLNQFVYTFVMGMFWGFLYSKTGRIRYSMIMHAVINFLGGVVAPWLLRHMPSQALAPATDAGEQLQLILEQLPFYIGLLCYAVCILGIVIAGIVLLIVFRKRFKLEEKGIRIPKGKGFVTVFVNLGMLTFAGYYICQIVAQLLE